ncbi:hypothetical protein PTI98_012444 [Pleurotus ostreatus]|nr:hypothetical protein PTI98_012444 [Pleurotus ostreatus]
MGKANKSSRSPQGIPGAQSRADSVDRDRKGKGKAGEVQEYLWEDVQENGLDYPQVDKYKYDREDEQEAVFPFTFRPPVAKPGKYAHLGPPSQYFSFTHITQTGADAHDTRVCINPEDIHRETSCVEGDESADAPGDKGTPAVPAATPLPREIAPLPKRARARASRARAPKTAKSKPPRTRINRKYTEIRDGVYVCSVCHLEMSKNAKNRHAPACGAPSPYAICEFCGRKSLNHRIDSTKRHQRSDLCWEQRTAYAVACVPTWSPAPRIAASERGSLASSAPYRFARGGDGGGGGGENGDGDGWVYSDSSDEEDELGGQNVGWRDVDGDVGEVLEDKAEGEDEEEDEGAGGDRDDGGDGDGDDGNEREYEHPCAINDEGARSEGEAWGGDAGCREPEDECVAGPSSVTLEHNAPAKRAQFWREEGWTVWMPPTYL